MIPALLIHAQPVHVFPEPPAGFRRYQSGQRLNNWSIALGSIDHWPIVRGPTQSDGLAGPLNRKAALHDQVGHNLPPLSRPQSFLHDILQRRIFPRHVGIETFQLAVLVL